LSSCALPEKNKILLENASFGAKLTVFKAKSHKIVHTQIDTAVKVEILLEMVKGDLCKISMINKQI
jgi:hypothetical protein